MKFIIFLFLLSVIENKCDEISGESYDRLQGPREAQVEWFPYEAVVVPNFCAGILISEQYVITPAKCVDVSSNVTVYLGFRGNPDVESNRDEKRSQNYKSIQVIVHENYESSEDINYNIALVKLSKTATLNEKVSPAKLISSKDMYPMENTFANLSGWSTRENSNMHETVKILSQDTCKSYFGSDRIENQNLCAECASSSTLLNIPGHALNVNNKIVGFLTKKLSCSLDDSSCKKPTLFVYLKPFLGWISEKTNIPIEKLTGENELEDSSKMSKKTDDQFEQIQKSQIKLEQEKVNCNAKMDSLLEEFEKTKEKMREGITSVKGNEAISINDLKTRIDNIQKTVDSILEESNVTKLNFEKQLEQVHKVSEEINIRVKRILEFFSVEDY